MVHRDLKPGNIVVDRGCPRIGDFGSVRSLGANGTETTASHHSVLYRPPECFATNLYSRRGDVYQVGLVTYQLLGGVLHYDGTRYLTRRQRKQYEEIRDQIDQSLFVDNVIRQRAEAQTLLDLTSLPPWISNGAKRAIREMTHPTPNERLSSMGDVAASMSQLRTTLKNWRLVGTIARLETEDRVLEIRPSTTKRYEAFQQRAGAFRRVPGLEPSTFSDLVTRCSR
jgi:serine/threonine protein kinase